jgi:hypothetical protein
MAKRKPNKDRAKAILWWVLWIAGLALLVGVSASLAGYGLGGAAGAAVGGLIGTIAGGWIGFSIAQQKPIPPKEEPEPPPAPTEPKPAQTPTPTPEPDVQPSSTEPAPDPASPVRHGRYVGNSHTHEIHDTENLSPACMFDTITEEHKVFLDSLEEVEQAIEKQGYDGCRWCMSSYDTDVG